MIKIFAEGTGDIQFLEKYLIHLLGENNNRWEFVDAGGYTSLNKIDSIFKENTDMGGVNLIIFDADSIENGGGYLARNKYILDKFEELSISAEIFLFPDNKSDGDFESLLAKIVNQEHNCLLECFEGYEMCVSGHMDENGNQKYITPNRKSKIYAYIDSIKKTSTERNRFKHKNDFFFEKSKFWDLDLAYITPLKEFILRSIK